MRTELGIKRLDLLIKIVLAAAAVFWLFLAGDELVERKKSLLGSGLWPVGDTDLTFERNYVKATENVCPIRGSYSVTNTGSVPFKIDSVEIYVVGLPPLDQKKRHEPTYINFSTDARLFPDQVTTDDGAGDVREKYVRKIVEGTRFVTRVDEVFGPGNKLERSYGYYIDKSACKNCNYAVVANASGGIPQPRKGTIRQALDFVLGPFNETYSYRFGKNDLRHISKVSSICDQSQDSVQKRTSSAQPVGLKLCIGPLGDPCQVALP